MKRILFIAICLLTGCIWGGYAQNKSMEVSGNVKDETGMPLIGVNISVKNTSGLGVITDINGNYKIKIAPYSTLIYSYIGMVTEEILVKENMKKVNVVMKESTKNIVDEVVITGTGVQKKVTVTGAVSTVDVELLKTPTSSITNALAGNVPGIMACRQAVSQEKTSQNSGFAVSPRLVQTTALWC